MLRNLWRIAGKVFLVALVLDAIYQIIVLHWFYPLQALIVATVLALVPCMLVRALGNRIVSMLRRSSPRRKRTCRAPARQTAATSPRSLIIMTTRYDSVKTSNKERKEGRHAERLDKTRRHGAP
jgi:hypothetical protein